MATITLDTDKVLLQSKYLPSEIRQKPCVDMTDMAALADVPESTLDKVFANEGGPQLFNIGRHRKALTEDFLMWLKGRRDSHPHVRGESRNPAGRPKKPRGDSTRANLV